MTKEEIQEAKMISREAVTDVMRSPVQTDEVEAAVLLLPKALDALEEANREIADLQTRLCNRMGCAPAVAFHFSGCPREQLATLGESTT